MKPKSLRLGFGGSKVTTASLRKRLDRIVPVVENACSPDLSGLTDEELHQLEALLSHDNATVEELRAFAARCGSFDLDAVLGKP